MIDTLYNAGAANLGAAWPVVWSLIKIVALLLPLLGCVAYLTLWERKAIGWSQIRPGPNRTGPGGLLQPIADAVKLIFKEIITPTAANKGLFFLGPIMTIMPALAAWAVIPFGPEVALANVNAGLLFLMAITSLEVYGVIIAGWASNSKYAFLGAIRSSAQMVSYEVSIGLIIITVILLAGSMNLSTIVEKQSGWIWNWNVFGGGLKNIVLLPVMVMAMGMFYISALAETNRPPFDLPEAESELTAGYHTEYSGMHFGLFYVAEFVNLFIIAGVASTIFLGGWMPLHISGWEGFNTVMDYIPGFVWFFGKTLFVIWLLMWIKWTFPRLRVDQILTLEWKYLVPIGLVNLLLMVVIVVFKLHF